MFLATIDKSKRLLVINYIGHVTAEQVRIGRNAAPALLAELPTGIRIIADYERLGSMDADTAYEVGKLMELADHKGVEIIVRVIPDSSKDIGLNILAAFHYRKPITSVTCANMEEAARALEL